MYYGCAAGRAGVLCGTPPRRERLDGDGIAPRNRWREMKWISASFTSLRTGLPGSLRKIKRLINKIQNPAKIFFAVIL